MQPFWIVIALSILLGAVELGARVTLGKSTMNIAQLGARLIDKFINFAHEDSLVRTPRVNDEVRHRQWWGYTDAQHHADHRPHFNSFMKTKMMAVKNCHRECGSNSICHETCPKPWHSFQENCAGLRRVWACHQKCEESHDGHACRAKCPSPKSFQFALKSDFIRQKCWKLQQITSCHGRCETGDFSCHHFCPNMWQAWNIHKHSEVADMDAEARHRRWWGYVDTARHGKVRMAFHEKMKMSMMEVKVCHVQCGPDVSCHQSCPQPWKRFQEKCTKLGPVLACHRDCRRKHGGHNCHSQCPLPGPTLASKIQHALRCHENCPRGDYSCYAACPRPLASLGQRCSAMQRVTSCHANCATGDLSCHHACPKMKGVWYIGGRKAAPTVSDEAHLRQWWGYHDEHHHGDHWINFRNTMLKRMLSVKNCHRRCDDDLSCHSGCPRPWRLFQDKCAKLEPAWTCHSECRRVHAGRACHAQCPMPEEKELAAQVLEAKRCQQACWKSQGGPACHRTCPMYRISKTCNNLRQVISCHDKCKPEDRVCHSSCPKMQRFWQFGRAVKDQSMSASIVV